MSFGNLFIHGLAGMQEQHLRQQYSADVVAANEGRAGFEGEEYSEQSDVAKSVTIDRVVRVNTVSDSIRSCERSFWKERKNQSLRAFSVTCVMGVASAIALVAASTAFPPFVGVIVITSIISFTCFGCSSLSLYRYFQAKGQYEKWEDPIPKLIEQRKQAGKKGFDYVYNKKLKGSLVTRTETQELWREQMEKLRTSFQTSMQGLTEVRAQMVRDFFNTGLLSGSKLDYAFSENPPLDLIDLSRQYENLHVQFTQLREVTDGCKQAIKRQKLAKLSANDRQRDLQLAPWIQWFNVNYREPLERERDVIILPHSRGRGAVVISNDRNPNVMMYNARLERMNAVFQAMTAPIYGLHEKNRRQINDWAESEMAKIQQGEDQQLELFFQPIVHVVSQYTDHSFEDFRQEERLYPDLHGDFEPSAPPFEELYAPSAPPLEEEYVPPSYDPNWQSVVGKVDWEQGVLEVTTTRRVYR